MNSLEEISPIDGRYRRHAEPLVAYFSEAALIRYRVLVEVEYLIAFSELGLGLRKLTEEERVLLRRTAEISLEDAQVIKNIEVKGYEGIPATNHDVKAAEYFLKLKLKETSLADVLEWIHFGLTSEDVNNLAYALMLGESIGKVMLAKLSEVKAKLDGFAEQYRSLPMLARTHGQPASPTTLGKEFKVFSARLGEQIKRIEQFELSAKLNGATGNWNAHVAAYPDQDWAKFSEEFIQRLGQSRGVKLRANSITTQIEPHDTYAELFDLMKRVNVILLDLDQDVWRYVSDGWLVQKPKEGEVGSSTMPHKVNPIDFENSEGNLGIANSLFEFFSRKLPVSRLQRDLSDSTVERNFGPALAHSLIAYESLLKGLGKISANETKIREELNNHPEVIAEAIQTILRREGAEMPYEKLKELTRGREVTLDDLHKFIDSLEVRAEVKEELKSFTPENYIGLAEKLANL